MTACPCACHSNGAFPPPCSTPGGCGPHEQQPHRCERGARCEAPEKLELAGQTYTVGSACDRALCTACEQATAGALTAAPALYAQLRAAARYRTGATAYATRVIRSRSGSFGLNATPLHLTENLHWHVTGWADQVILTADRPTVDRTAQPEPDQVADACALLARYLSVWIAHGPADFQVTRDQADPDDPKAQPTADTVTFTQAGWEACAWLIAWRDSAERLLRLPVLIHHPPEPCPQCDTAGALRRRDGEDRVWCSSCGKAWTLDKYEIFVHAWVGGAA